MSNTYAIKGEEIMLVTIENKDSLMGYTFKSELTEYEQLLFEKQTFESNGYDVEIINGECIKTSTDLSDKYEIKLKLNRMKEIREELVKLGFTSELPSEPRIETQLQAKKIALQNEWDSIKLEVSNNYSSSLIDDVITLFFT